MNSAKPYALKLKQLVDNIGARVSGEVHPFLEVREEVKSTGVIVISSDRGLCGAFNSNITKAFLSFTRDNRDKKLKIITVGRKIDEFLKKENNDVVSSYTSFGGRIRYDDAVEIGEKLSHYFVDGEIDELYIIYNEFRSIMLQTPRIVKILPVTLTETEGDITDYLYEPDPKL